VLARVCLRLPRFEAMDCLQGTRPGETCIVKCRPQFDHTITNVTGFSLAKCPLDNIDPMKDACICLLEPHKPP